MGLFDKDDYDDVNLESLDGLAYDELNQKLHEYNKAMANEDKDIIEAKKEKKKRRKRGLGESLILNIQDNHVRTMNEEKRNCEHLHRFPASRRAGGICPGRSPGEKN